MPPYPPVHWNPAQATGAEPDVGLDALDVAARPVPGAVDDCFFAGVLDAMADALLAL